MIFGGGIGPWIGGGVVLALLAGGWWAIDAYGDLRALQCHGAYARAAGETNAAIGDLNSDEGQAELVAAALTAKALERLRSSPAPPGLLATKEQAKALSEIRYAP